MELHSYAKRRTLKKWTIEQKRKLVEARIAHDSWFTNKPSSVVPWKNILIAANLVDFNVFFVRKQWSNMLARYKMYKQTRLGSNIASKAIDAELIKRINQEWEFFETIHTYMTRKTTNLHSYALTHRTDSNNIEQHENNEALGKTVIITEQEHHHRHQNQANTPTKLLLNDETITLSLPKDCVKENIPNNTTMVLQSNNISQDDGIQIFSSDTNEDFQVIAETTRIINSSKTHQPMEDEEEDESKSCVRNTDHDFYSKRSLGNVASKRKRREENDLLQEQQSSYFADASEESQGSLNMIGDLLQMNKHTNALTKLANDSSLQDLEIKSETIINYLEPKEELQDQEFLHERPSTSTQANLAQNIANPRPPTKSHISERDKYYRHKRRFNRRLERRFDAIIQVMGQIVKAEYPNVDVTPLVGTSTSLASCTANVLSSDSELDSEVEDDDSNVNVLKATPENQ